MSLARFMIRWEAGTEAQFEVVAVTKISPLIMKKQQSKSFLVSALAKTAKPVLSD